MHPENSELCFIIIFEIKILAEHVNAKILTFMSALHKIKANRFELVVSENLIMRIVTTANDTHRSYFVHYN